MLGPYIKSMGTVGHQNVSKCRPHYSRDICTRKNNWKPVFHIWPKCEKNVQFLAIWGGGGLSFHPYLCTCEIRKQSDNNFLSSNPKYDNFFSYLGVLGGPYQIFRAVWPHHRADLSITTRKITTSFSYMSPNVNKCAFLAIFFLGGGTGWPFNYQTCPTFRIL